MLCPNCHAQTDNYCGKNITNPEQVSKKVEIKKEKPKYNQLFSKELLDEKLNDPSFNNFDELAKELGIGRKTLQKLCREYGLPGSKTEMGLVTRNKLNDVKCQYCSKIFKPARKDAKYCSLDCFRKAEEHAIPKEITKEEILEKVKDCKSMKQLANHFGYKDLRNTCKKVGLPHSINELKKLI